MIKARGETKVWYPWYLGPGTPAVVDATIRFRSAKAWAQLNSTQIATQVRSAQLSSTQLTGTWDPWEVGPLEPGTPGTWEEEDT